MVKVSCFSGWYQWCNCSDCFVHIYFQTSVRKWQVAYGTLEYYYSFVSETPCAKVQAINENITSAISPPPVVRYCTRFRETNRNSPLNGKLPLNEDWYVQSFKYRIFLYRIRYLQYSIKVTHYCISRIISFVFKLLLRNIRRWLFIVRFWHASCLFQCIPKYRLPVHCNINDVLTYVTMKY